MLIIRIGSLWSSDSGLFCYNHPMNPLPLFPYEMHIKTLCKKNRSRKQIIADQLAEIERKSFTQLSRCFRLFIPSHLLQPAKLGRNSRKRLFSKETTFWAFFSQILCADGGCAEVMTKLRASAALKGVNVPIPDPRPPDAATKKRTPSASSKP
jgi:hypothetical protein